MSYHKLCGSTRSLALQWLVEQPTARVLLQKRSCRAFELDFYGSDFKLANVAGLDECTTIANVSAYVRAMSKWSSRHRMHDPLFLFLRHHRTEAALGAAGWARVRAAVDASWDYGFVRSSDVIGQSGSRNWPRLSEARGKLVLVFQREQTWNDDGDYTSPREDSVEFFSEPIQAYALRSASKLTAFFDCGTSTAAAASAVAASAASCAAAMAEGAMSLSHPDAEYVRGGERTASDSLEAAARVADRDANGVVTAEEMASFLNAFGRSVDSLTIKKLMSVCAGGTREPKRGYSIASAMCFLSAQASEFAAPTLSFSAAVDRVAASFAAGHHIIFSNFPGANAAKGGSGFFVAFANGAAIACNAKTPDACPFPTALELLSQPELGDTGATETDFGRR
jgi:hypothetical protein